MAISFVAASHNGSGDPTEPTGAAQDDFLIAITQAGGSGATGAAGWTQIGINLQTGSTFTANAWYIKRGSSAPSYAFNGSFTVADVLCYRGASSVTTSANSSAGSAV